MNSSRKSFTTLVSISLKEPLTQEDIRQRRLCCQQEQANLKIFNNGYTTEQRQKMYDDYQKEIDYYRSLEKEDTRCYKCVIQ